MDILTGLFAAGVVTRVVGALVILVVAWLIALLISSVVRRLLRSARLNQRFAGPATAGQAGVDFEGLVSSVVFWLIMLFGIVAAFDILQLPLITTPLTGVLGLVLAYLPRLFAGLILVLIAWVVARILRAIVTQALTAANVDQRIAASRRPRTRTGATSTGSTTYSSSTVPPATDETAPASPSLAQSLGEVVYWLTFLFFLPAILGAFGLEGLLAPVQGLLDTILLFLPNLAAAALILVVGYFVARIVQRIVSELLEAAGADRLADRTGLDAARTVRISDIVGTIVFVLIIVPVITAALNTLGLAAVTQPLSNMINLFLAAIPSILAAAVILAVAYFLGRIVADLIARILAGLGLDRVPARLGLTREPVMIGTRLSDAVGSIIFAVILVTAAMEASRILGFGLLADLLAGLIVFGVRVGLGLVLFAVGLWLAGLAYRAIIRSGLQHASLLANVARISIVVLATAMALRETGLANDIVNLAFGLTLGAVAVAAALAFGLGGREVARQQLENWRAQAELDSLITPTRTTTRSVPPTTPNNPPRG